MALGNHHSIRLRIGHALRLVLTLTNGLTACGNSGNSPITSQPHCDQDATRIHDVQGPFDASPLVGQAVSIEAIVVGDFQGDTSLGGFFVQEQDTQVDKHPDTSEGLFIYTGSQSKDVQLGDVVRVTGTVSEYQGMTELSDVTEVRICDSGASVSPALVNLPVASMADLEAFEGMSVSFPGQLFVTDTHDLGHYGRVTLSSKGRLFQPTNIVAPGAAAQALQANQCRASIEIDDGSNLEYPPVPPFLGQDNTLRLGDSIRDLLGVLSDASGTYRVLPLNSADRVSFARDNPRPASPMDPGGSLKVASFNLDNYFTTLDTGSPVCGPQARLDCRGANTRSEFERQRAKLVSALALINADIVGLVELENNPSASIQDLVQGLNAQLGADTYAFLDTGTIGTDAIKVGLIYKPSQLTPLGDFAVLDSSVDPKFNDKLNRPVLAQSFEQRSNAERFTMALNHWKSKGSDCPNDADIGDGQGSCNLTRTAAAQAEIAWLATDPTRIGDADVLLMGDLNSYAMEDPICALTNAGYVNLVVRFMGTAAYSYAFDGRSGTLDQALASPSLGSQVVGATEWHINADEPPLLDYNEETNPPILYAADPFRSSDHDPLIIGLQLGGAVSQ